ncbi:MAG: carboxypeptidase regulatory-like domain-containing protein [Acidobacteria bacterium]|nr:carboxypeptidase regulatory-like domain-containing protein [Acidobacteriota bacterium]
MAGVSGNAIEKRYAVRLIVMAIGCAFGLASYAQLPTALGTVRDSSGAVVPGTKITARSMETGQSRTTASAADGSYRLPALPVGAYEVRAEQSGFQTSVQTGLTLAVSQEAVVNFSLQVGAVEQSVAVTAEAPLVNTTSGSLGGNFDLPGGSSGGDHLRRYSGFGTTARRGIPDLQDCYYFTADPVCAEMTILMCKRSGVSDTL